ncbi:hypothetical protein RD792_006879 [Penstemon davidsonii]|uniref:Chlorophyll a-b binding protein, chloroplastic n=1 Tax=Penstemon davidsonii TaxID=160366 RepID=A0ABR0D4V7_9LAMI|nr:hypothetical protein RD792_006879 [Penstemon davidsonii]
MASSNSFWFKSGFHIFSEGGLDHLGNPNSIHAQSILAIWATQVLMALIEGYRVGKDSIRSTLTKLPTRWPLGFADDPKALLSRTLRKSRMGG